MLKNKKNIIFLVTIIPIFINENKINFSYCEISIDGFHKFNDHTNKKGYNKIRQYNSKSLLNLNNID